MKQICKYLGLFLAFVCMIFCSRNANAQGWQWGKTATNVCYASGTSESEITSNAIVDKSGNLITGGYNLNIDSTLFGTNWFHTDSGVNNLFITKLDSSGNFLWVKGVRHCYSDPLQIATDSFENIYIFGFYAGGNFSCDAVTLTNPTGAEMFFVAKLSPLGNMLWAKNLGTDSEGLSRGIISGGIGTDKQGNVYVSGNFSKKSDTIGSAIMENTDTTGSTSDFYIVKFDSSGNNIWAKTYCSVKSEYSEQLTILPNGESYVVFRADSTFSLNGFLTISGLYYPNSYTFLAKFDTIGNAIWVKPLPRNAHPTQTISDPYGIVYMIGSFDSTILLGGTSLTSNGHADVFVTKYDSSGSVSWAKSTGGTQSDLPLGIAIDANLDVWISGSMYAYAVGYTISLSGHTLSVPIGSTDPLFIAEYDSAGFYMNSMTLKSGGDDWLGIAIDNYGNMYLCSDYWHTSMMLGCDTLPYPAPEDEAIFITKYSSFQTPSCLALNSDVTTFAPDIYIYPNPTNTDLTIAAQQKITQITITNLLGQTVYTNSNNANKVQVNVSELLAGIYFVRINDAIVRKFVKE